MSASWFRGCVEFEFGWVGVGLYALGYVWQFSSPRIHVVVVPPTIQWLCLVFRSRLDYHGIVFQLGGLLLLGLRGLAAMEFVGTATYQVVAWGALTGTFVAMCAKSNRR